MVDFNQLSNYKKVSFVFQQLQFVISFFGIVSNILIICVFCRRGLRKYSYSFYSQAMAVGDIIIQIHTYRKWAKAVFNADLELVSPIFCAIDEFQAFVGGSSSMWILLLISIDRLVTIVYPNHLKILKKRWVQSLLVAAVVVINICLRIPLPIYYRIISIPSGPGFVQMCSLPSNISSINSWLTLANTFSIAFVINTGLNLKILLFIARSRQRVAVNIGGQTNSNTSTRDRKFARATIGLCATGFFMRLPFAISLLVINNVQMNIEITQMIFLIGSTFNLANNGVSFAINMAFNSVFYEEFLVMIRVRKIRSVLNTVSGFGIDTRRSNKSSLNTEQHLKY